MICDKSSVNAKFLAASAKIDLRTTTDMQSVGFHSVVGEYLILMLELSGTNPLRAASATVRAYTDYSGPIKTYRHGSGSLPEAHMNKRSGDLILWERSAIGASSNNGDDLVSPLTEAIDTLLKAFFADYLNAQKLRKE